MAVNAVVSAIVAGNVKRRVKDMPATREEYDREAWEQERKRHRPEAVRIELKTLIPPEMRPALVFVSEVGGIKTAYCRPANPPRK